MYSTLFGLLATTGMRISEALALRLIDVTADGLIIQQTKFQKSRLIPVHGTTWRALDEYLVVRALGHAHVTDTYWYLQATPILMGQIAEAGEALHRGAAA